jgi:hypothetical protein
LPTRYAGITVKADIRPANCVGVSLGGDAGIVR